MTMMTTADRRREYCPSSSASSSSSSCNLTATALMGDESPPMPMGKFKSEEEEYRTSTPSTSPDSSLANDPSSPACSDDDDDDDDGDSDSTASSSLGSIIIEVAIDDVGGGTMNGLSLAMMMRTINVGRAKYEPPPPRDEKPQYGVEVVVRSSAVHDDSQHGHREEHEYLPCALFPLASYHATKKRAAALHDPPPPPLHPEDGDIDIIAGEASTESDETGNGDDAQQRTNLGLLLLPPTNYFLDVLPESPFLHYPSTMDGSRFYSTGPSSDSNDGSVSGGRKSMTADGDNVSSAISLRQRFCDSSAAGKPRLKMFEEEEQISSTVVDLHLQVGLLATTSRAGANDHSNIQDQLLDFKSFRASLDM